MSTNKWIILKSKRWKLYWIGERNIKNHDDMDHNEKRTIIVLSNAKSLLGYAIILECSTKKQNHNSVWIGYRKNYKNEIIGNSYAMTDRILIIPIKWLRYSNLIA
ncbi:MAG: hypothetical protein LBF36_03480 [Mycoplasmataceae bacterium]|jgi:hypothetical protein|nr:hypothetical protein [Mycoplasmataceae bacterium]